MEMQKVRIPVWVQWSGSQRFSRADVVEMSKENATRAHKLLAQLREIREELKRL